MNEESMTEAFVRGFLLGELTDEERERIESLYLTDLQTRERVLDVEQDLIEDYLEGSLSKEDKQRFVLRYARTYEERRKLKITKSIKDWAVTEAGKTHAAAASTLGDLRLRPVLVVTIAAMVVIAVMLAIGWRNSNVKQLQHLKVEQELAELNSPTSMHEIPPQTISLDLKPVTVRGVEPQTQFHPRAEIRIVQLRLPWIQKERYSLYQAEIRKLGDDALFTIHNLQAQDGGGYVIRVRLQAHMLSKGNYQISLRGITAEGVVSPSEEYKFGVND